ncbi:MAG: hypothetical protein QF464_04050 [Myxococcota bacterium]|jgi:hypothetical protein|nr:hypothetical protein [Myxococcota bacterium]
MPSLSPITILGDLSFIGQGKKIPVDWSQPQDTDCDGNTQYNAATSDSEKMGVPTPMCYFFAASTNKYHTEAAKEIGGQFKDFVHEAIDKTKMAVDMWRLQAKFKDLKVMSVCAIGMPGCLDGPKLKDCYVGWVGTESNQNAYIDAVKDGISECWEAWQGQVMVPGLPWYPAFAAFPLASAPPMPNVPMPLITCPSAQMAKMTVPTQLRDAMVNALDSGLKNDDADDQHVAAFEAIGTVIALAFLMWLPQQQIMLVMGKGPVPTYAPPYVPVGPVIGGDNIAAPGHLAV